MKSGPGGRCSACAGQPGASRLKGSRIGFLEDHGRIGHLLPGERVGAMVVNLGLGLAVPEVGGLASSLLGRPAGAGLAPLPLRH